MSNLKTALVVLGMHRSGTSALTRVLSLLGATLPQTVIHNDAHNATGYWESKNANALNEELLNLLGLRWHSIRSKPKSWAETATSEDYGEKIVTCLNEDFGDTNIAVLKEPRIARLFPVWREAIEHLGADLKVIIPIRNPFEVSASLNTRDKFPLEKCLLLWLRYVLEAETYSRGLPRVFVTYDDLLYEWRRAVERIGEVLGISWPTPPAQAASEIDQFLRPELQHHRRDDGDLPFEGFKTSWVRDTYACHLRLVENANDTNEQTTLDRIAEELEAQGDIFAQAVDLISEQLISAQTEAVQQTRLHEEAVEQYTRLHQEVRELAGEIDKVKRVAGQSFAQPPPIRPIPFDLGTQGDREVEMARLSLSHLSCFALQHYRDSARFKASLIPRIRHQIAVFRKSLRPFMQTSFWLMTGRLPVKWRLATDCHATLRSGLFDPAYYRRQCAERAMYANRAVLDWLVSGISAGLSPHPLFDLPAYLNQAPELDPKRTNPLLHYIQNGGSAGLSPNPWFDSAWYLKQFPDSAPEIGCPLIHYLEIGAAAGFDPHPRFSTDWYLTRYMTAQQSSGITPLEHFLRFGQDHKHHSFPDDSMPRPKQAALTSFTGATVRHAHSLVSRWKPPTRWTHQTLLEHTRGDGRLKQAKRTEPVSGYPPVKLLAFYLPQFHPIDENNRWWGEGFTEWTGVTQALPQFRGHYQPHLPADLGYYDLRLPETLYAQIELAKHFGIYGFCFYHYWFGGKRLLERPLDMLLRHKDMNIRFCLCWANENWSRRWDGSEHDVLMAQEYTPQNDQQFIDDLIPYVEDERYIHVNGRPLLLVYRIDQIPNPKGTIETWNARCSELGIQQPYIIAVQTFGIQKPTTYGVSSAVEFPPHMHAPFVKRRRYNPEFLGRVSEYDDLVKVYTDNRSDGFELFKTVSPCWDNTARKKGAARVFDGCSPEKYHAWLRSACSDAIDRLPEERRFVFINAWNEWAEGAHLEPDQRYGFAYLNATADVLETLKQDRLSKQNAG